MLMNLLIDIKGIGIFNNININYFNLKNLFFVDLIVKNMLKCIELLLLNNYC